MSKSHHPLPKNLADNQNEPHKITTIFESSFLSNLHHSLSTSTYSNHTTTTSSTTTKIIRKRITPTIDRSFFNSKHCPSSDHHQKQRLSSTLFCSNVDSFRGRRNWRFSYWKFIGLYCNSFSLFMATEADTLVYIPTSTRRDRKKKSGQQNKKEELEKEVSMLHKMLGREESVHSFLERTIRQSDGTPTHLPSFLPPEVKELLAELAMVEDEIVRLEGEVRNLQNGLNQEQEISNKTQSKHYYRQHENPSKNPNSEISSILPENPKPITSSTTWVYEKMPFEAKALHFISKAIKGDYNINDFTRNQRMGNVTASVKTDQKENFGMEEDESFQDKISKKSGLIHDIGLFQERVPKKSSVIQKQPYTSPMRPPRHATSKRIEVDFNSSMELPPKSFPKQSSSPFQDISSQKLQPNKLSESIMKCLIFIYVRLMRQSRALELEKLSTVSRSSHSPFSTRSFRADTNLNSSKESRQQDPYSIFDIEDSIPRDVGPYKNLVRFTSISLDPKSISSPSSIPLLQKLRALMNNLQNVDLRFLTHQQKLAFWINMYNACMMHGFLVYGVPSSPEKLLALMNKATMTIGGNKIKALAIEHFILRQSSSTHLKNDDEYEKETVAYNIYGLELPEPNVTFALCCGTRSSPSIRIYTADGILAELEKSKLEYLQASIAVISTKKLVIPELLLQNLLDFAIDVDSLIEWIWHQLPTSCSLRKLMVDCLRGHTSGKISHIVEKMPYDFEFQYLLSV